MKEINKKSSAYRFEGKQPADTDAPKCGKDSNNIEQDRAGSAQDRHPGYIICIAYMRTKNQLSNCTHTHKYN